MEDVLAVYNRPVDPKRARLCFDERPCQLLEDVVIGLQVKPGKAAKEDNEYVRQGTAVVLLAYDLETGQRYTQVRKQRTKADYTEFIQQIVSSTRDKQNSLRNQRARWTLSESLCQYDTAICYHSSFSTGSQSAGLRKRSGFSV